MWNAHIDDRCPREGVAAVEREWRIRAVGVAAEGLQRNGVLQEARVSLIHGVRVTVMPASVELVLINRLLLATCWCKHA